MVATRASRKMAFFLLEPSNVEDFVGLPSLSGRNLSLQNIVEKQLVVNTQSVTSKREYTI